MFKSLMRATYGYTHAHTDTHIHLIITDAPMQVNPVTAKQFCPFFSNFQVYLSILKT